MRRILPTLLLFIYASAYSQQSAYVKYGVNEGLSQSQVRAISQDQNGFMWFGTVGGLSRFDGYDFTNYSTEDGLPSNQINCLLEGTQYLWIGTSGSICRYTGTRFENIPLPPEFSDSKIFDMAEDDSGNLWLAFTGQGLLKFDGKSFEAYGISKGLTSTYVRNVGNGRDGQLWIGTREGIYLYENDSIRVALPLLSDVSIADILICSDGSLVVSTFGSGIFIVNDSQIRQFTVEDGLPSNHIRCAVELPNGEIWLGAKEGLIRFQNNKFSVFRENQGLPYSNIKSLGVDRGGNLWIGTDGQGVLMQAGRSFTRFDVHDGLHSDLVMDICKTDTGSLLFGSYDNGLAVYDGKKFSKYPYSDSLPNMTVWVLQKDPQGVIWAGTSQGVFREDHGSITVVDESMGLPGNRVTALISGSEGMWAGAEKGFALLNTDGTIRKVYTDSTGFDGKRIRSLIETEGGLWIGAEGRVYRLKSGKFTSFAVDSLNEKPVYCLAEDAYSHIWIGTSAGLYVLNARTRHIEEVQLGSKYSSRNINFITTLKDSTLLLGTNNGVYRIQTKTFQEGGSLKAKHYTNYEGLSSSETNQNAVFQDGNTVWFGTTSGAIKFDPNRDPFSREVAPALNLSKVQLFLQDVDWTKWSDSVNTRTGLPEDVVLPYNQNYLTFYFAGIYLSNPQKVRYRYFLEGADENWLGPTSNRSVTYAYLPHGDYSFHIEAYSIDEPELISTLHFDFSITPPFYLTPWFFILLTLFILGVLYALYLNQIRKEYRKRMTLKLEFQSRLMELESQSLNSSMNRHFIFNALNSIQYYINKQDRKSANRYLTSFAKLIRKNLDSSQQNETTLSEELSRLELYLSLEQMRFQGKFTYAIHTDAEIDIETVKIPSMMLQPFLENSIWHGILPSDRPGKIDLNIHRETRDVTIEIRDNGIGYFTSISRKTNGSEGHISKGMEITQNRIELYRKMTGLAYEIIGPEEIKNTAGETLGTTVKIRIPDNGNANI